ncbi:UNVERIFIED_ORG: hypothetical protein ABIB52_003854 [Arthrobacter sp. UYCu721]
MLKLPVDDHDEVLFSSWIMRLFERAAAIDDGLAPLLNPQESSPLCSDDARIPHFPVSGYAAGQLSVATGCISSLKQMMVRESETNVDMLASPFGAYTLVRNALDAAVVALWLLEPINGTLRIKRRILLGVDEISKGAAFREAMGQHSTREKRRARMQEVAELAGLGLWNPLSKKAKLPSTTQMLTDLERWHSNAVMPWLAAWQLASGHAHGKLWAHIASHELQEVEGTRTATGAHFQMTIRYGMLAAVLFEAVQLLETAGIRYRELSG